MTQPPDWAISVPGVTGIHTEPANSNVWQNLSQDQLNTLRTNLINSILQIFIMAAKGVLTPGGIQSTLQQLNSVFQGVLGTDFLNGPWSDLLNGLLDGSALGNIPQELLSLIPINILGTPQSTTPMTASTFPDASSVSGAGMWTWSPTVTRTVDGTGSMQVTADGTMKAARGVAISVSGGQKINPSMWVHWTGYVGAGPTVQMQVINFSGTLAAPTELGTTTINSITPTAGTGGWTELTGNYSIPSGTTHVRTRLVVTAGATNGTFNFDDGTYELSSNFVDNLTSWLNLPSIGNLFGDPSAFNPTDLIPVPLQGLTDTIFQAISQFNIFGNTLDDLFAALQAIPFGNILGIGGPANIGSSLQNSWDQLIGGFVGTSGTGASLADLFNIGNLVSSWASLGRNSWDVLNIRSNKSLNNGLLSTSESNFSLDNVALAGSAPTFGVTSSTAITAFQRISEGAAKAVVSWLGSGTTSITDFRVNIWQMDTTTGAMNLVHNSANIIGNLSPSMQWNVYQLPTAINVLPGEVYGIELETRAGAGTHSVAGRSTWLPNHPSTFPRNMAATRNAGGVTPPSSIASGSVSYATNVPFVEFGIQTGDVEIHDVQTIPYTSSASLPVPTWVNFVDRVAVGAGGGGHGGTGTWGINGEGGNAGTWASDTLVRGTDFTGNPTITVTIGTRGVAGAFFANGGNATNTTIAIAGGSTLTATGGAGGNTLGDSTGDAAGSHNHNGVTYSGGGAQNTTGADGPSPGSGGGGGGYGQTGGNGGTSAAWLVFRQS